jgi:hypothetical protein
MYFNFNKRDILNKYKVIKIYKIYTNIYHNLKKIIFIVKSLLKKHNINHDNEFVRAIGNSMRHGRCPIKCTIYIFDNNESLLTIKDSGKGFDFIDVINKYEDGVVYYQYHGKGTKILYQSKKLYFDWDKEGSRILLLFTKKNLNKLNKPNKLNKSIKIKKIKLNNSDESICNCHKCISLQRRHVN